MERREVGEEYSSLIQPGRVCHCQILGGLVALLLFLSDCIQYICSVYLDLSVYNGIDTID